MNNFFLPYLMGLTIINLLGDNPYFPLVLLNKYHYYKRPNALMNNPICQQY